MLGASSFQEFAEAAQPHAWLLTADNLHEQAKVLYKQKNEGFLTLKKKGARTLSWSSSDKTAFLLCGFAIENLIKGFLVYENPHWVSNGQLSRNLRSHNLVDLRDSSKLIPDKRRFTKLLGMFSAGIESWARYPCGLDIQQTTRQPNYSQKLWQEYNSLMRSYGDKLLYLLGQDWKGAHGFHGRYSFSGVFFEA